MAILRVRYITGWIQGGGGKLRTGHLLRGGGGGDTKQERGGAREVLPLQKGLAEPFKPC